MIEGAYLGEGWESEENICDLTCAGGEKHVTFWSVRSHAEPQPILCTVVYWEYSDHTK